MTPKNIRVRFYSTSANALLKLRLWFITGFSDAEGSFNIVVTKSLSTKIGWRVQARFIIELHLRDIVLLNMIQSTFDGIGNITINTNRNSVRFIVVNLNDLVDVVVPHFEKYPLQSAKK